MCVFWWRNACHLLLLSSQSLYTCQEPKLLRVLERESKKRKGERERESLKAFDTCLLCSPSLVVMERHRCKLCFRSFGNGRALGGHMKAHLATLPLPPKTLLQQQPTEPAASSSSYSSAEQVEEEVEAEEDKANALAYGLRENPKKSFRLADPEFSFAVDAAGPVVIQDRESETESRNPTRRRSKRNRRPNLELKKAKLRRPSWVDSPEPVSSVSDASTEEDVAMCLMMLSRDVWLREENNKTMIRSVNEEDAEEEEEIEIIKLKKKVRAKAKYRCEKCNKVFRSHQAMCGHKRICYRNETEAYKNGGDDDKIFECPYCYKVFGSGQALGGHKRSHQLNSSATSTTAIVNINSVKQREGLIDLNLPAPLEEDEFSSVLSDA